LCRRRRRRRSSRKRRKLAGCEDLEEKSVKK